MKYLIFFVLWIVAVSCDPYNFGFKKNPIYILGQAFKAVVDLDQVGFIEATGNEALCVYGNAKGLTYLKENLDIQVDNIELVPKVLSSKYFTSPQFVGYWSYYTERYIIDVIDSSNGKKDLQAIVECNYGTEGTKSIKLQNLEPSEYKRIECRLIKIIPLTFESLPIKSRCQGLKVSL